MRVMDFYRRHWQYCTMVGAALSVCVGINLVVYSVVNALWVRPLPFAHSERLVTLPEPYVSSLDVSWLSEFESVAGQVVTANSLLGLRPEIRIAGSGQELEVLGVSENYFAVLGLPVIGREFGPQDSDQTGVPSAVISHRIWTTVFAADAGVVGRIIQTMPVPVRVVGIAPEGFGGARRGERTDLWLPRAAILEMVSGHIDWTTLPMMVIARLAPGDTPMAAERRLKEKVAADPLKRNLSVVPLKSVFGTPESRTLVVREGTAVVVVGALAFVVLLGGCASIAAVMIVHYERRRGEFAVRLSLGARRGDIFRQLCVESVPPAVLGAIGAVMIVVAVVQAVPALTLPGGVDLGRLDLSVDWRVALVAVAACAITLAVSASGPARMASRAGVTSYLTGIVISSRGGSERNRQVLLGVQAASTVVVMCAAALFVHSVREGMTSVPGFDVDRTLFVSVQAISPLTYPTQTWQTDIQTRAALITETIGGVAGVATVAEGMAPIGRLAAGLATRPITIVAGGGEHVLNVGRINGGPGYCEALGLPVLAGRTLNRGDTAGSPLRVVVTAKLAQRLWPKGSAVGQLMSTNWRGGRLEVVGVVADLAFGSVTADTAGVVITASGGTSALDTYMVIRTETPTAIAENVRRRIKQVIPDAPIVNLSTGAELIRQDLRHQRLGAWFFSGFGLSALLLGTWGVFGLVAYFAEAGRKEWGIRSALGATPADLVRAGVRVALVPVIVGATVGLLVGVAVLRVFESFLVGFDSWDLLIYVLVFGVVVLSAGASGLLGAARLRRLAPSDALRSS